MEVGDVQEKLNLDRDAYSEIELHEDFYARLRFNSDSQLMGDVKAPKGNGATDDSSGDTDEEEEEEEEFSFAYGGEPISPVAAEDAFAHGQIKPVFPLFNQELLLLSGGDSDSDSDSDSFIENLPVKKVFVETANEESSSKAAVAGNDGIVGPYCEWSNRKAVEASQQQACKKSNSTGFSKIWRLKEFRARCNSDGRDAYVFLNHARRAPAATKNTAEAVETAEGTKTKVKKDGKGKSKTTPLSAHEVYLRSKKKDGERRRRSPSYLPYRPELVGIFTTVHGGLTKNVHPF